LAKSLIAKRQIKFLKFVFNPTHGRRDKLSTKFEACGRKVCDFDQKFLIRKTLTKLFLLECQALFE